MTPAISEADPFDLPSWVGEKQVTWYADSGARFGHHIQGRVTADGQADLPCDLLAIDQAYPRQVADSGWRRQAHQAWHNDQVLLVDYGGRLTLAVPGHEFTADLVLAAMFRFSKAVGGQPENFVAALRLGSVGRSAR
ncbi:hypothetical protein [Nocardioides sp.]|uniref:hypothetical protein n=1 Tax=Nocardioides sp. TaxID=35761 RepID=UPI003D0A2033